MRATLTTPDNRSIQEGHIPTSNGTITVEEIDATGSNYESVTQDVDEVNVELTDCGFGENWTPKTAR